MTKPELIPESVAVPKELLERIQRFLVGPHLNVEANRDEYVAIVIDVERLLMAALIDGSDGR